MKITFIGLGIMGSQMALNLLQGDHKITVYNRSPKPMKALEKEGAMVPSSVDDAVADADLVISMLANPEAVTQVFFGKNGVLSKMKKNAIWLDSSTVNPSFSLKAGEEAESWEIQFIDAPVAGSKNQARDKELVFFTGGDKTLIDELEPVLLTMGKKVVYLGATGMGSSFKMLVNKMLAESMIIYSEAVHLGQKMGIEDHFLFDVLPTLPVIAPFVGFKTAGMKTGNYETQFPLELMYKDLQLAAQTAYEHQQSLFMANLAKERYAQAIGKGEGRNDFSAIHKL